MRGWIAIPLALLVVAGIYGCNVGHPILQRQWEADWEFLRVGQQWVRGVDLSTERSFVVDHTGLQFRSRVLNKRKRETPFIISGPDVQLRLTVPARGYLDVATDPLPRGRYQIKKSRPLILGEPRLVEEGRQPELLVFVVVDTLREDAVTLENTPQILEFFNGFTRFPDTSANAPWTIPSVASLFTSRPVLDLTTPTGDIIGIPDGAVTWANTLHRAGFSGGAVVANSTVHVQNGFAQGFDSFLVPSIIPVRGGGPDATWVVGEAEKWLAAHSGEDGFLYLHLMDPHEPYRDHEDGQAPPDLFELAHRMRTALPEEIETIRKSYTGEVRYVDRILGPFLKSLPENAVVVFTSDHGEMLGENGCWGHGFTLFQPVIQVPLLIRAQSLKGRTDSRPTQLLDLAPTILDVLNEQIPFEMEGRSLLQDHPQRSFVAATFSAGPMRWMWRRGNIKVMIRTADQPDVADGSRRSLEETAPLPAGVFCYDLEEDPNELSSQALPAGLLPSVANDFALSAGSMVPGLQVFSVGATGGTIFELEYPGERVIRQIWSVGPVSASWTGPTVHTEDPNSRLLSLVAIGNGGVAKTVTPRYTTAEWQNLVEGEDFVPPGLNHREAFSSPGIYIWWNPERNIVVGHHDETLEKLRALGYLK